MFCVSTMQLPISRDNRLCHFCSHNVVETQVHFVLECPYVTPLGISSSHITLFSCYQPFYSDNIQ